MARWTMSPARISAPVWCGDFLDRDALFPYPIKLDATKFLKPDAAVATVGVAGAAQGATSVPVAATANLIPAGTQLDFGGAKLAILTADAVAGATTLTVRALPTALVSGDKATYPGAGTTLLSVPSGTVIGRTLTERNANALWRPAVDTDDEITFVAYDVPNLLDTAEAVGVRNNTVIKENYLPHWGDVNYWPTALVTVLRGRFRMILGVD